MSSSTVSGTSTWRCSSRLGAFLAAFFAVLSGGLAARAAFAARPVLSGPEETVLSADHRFLFHFTRSGADAVSPRDESPRNGVPDYIDDVMEGIRRGYESWVTLGGWPAPAGDQGVGGDDRLDVYVKQLTCEDAGGVAACGPDGRIAGFLFGVTRGEDPIPGSDNGLTSFITLNASNDVPLGRNFAQSVAAHEFHHVIQFAMDTAEPNWFYEATAAYLQLTLFDFLEESPYIVDALLLDRLGKPEVSLATTLGRIEYSNALWFRYLVDRFDAPEIVREMWTTAAAAPGRLYEAFETVLRAHGSTFLSALAEWGEWNYFLCGRDDGHHYAGGELCTSPNVSVRLDASHTSYPVAQTTVRAAPEPMGMAYVEFKPRGRGKDLVVDFSADASTPWRLRLLRVATDCGTSAEEVTVDAQGKATFRVDDFHRYQAATLLVVNAATRGSRAVPFTYTARTEGTYSGPEASAEVSQKSLVVAPSALTFAAVGETRELAAIARFSDCTSLNTTRLSSVIWLSGDVTVASVTSSGVVTAVGPGTTFVVAAFGGQEAAQVPVSVGAPVVTPPPPAVKPGGCAAAEPRSSWASLLVLLALLSLVSAAHRRSGSPRDA